MIALFILLTLVSYLIDISTLKCKVDDIRVEILRFIHHIIASYGYFGSLFFGHYEFHLIYMVSVWLGWKIMKRLHGDEYCFVTRFVNDICGFNNTEKFHDIIWFSPLNNVHYMVFLFDFIMILKTRNLLG